MKHLMRLILAGVLLIPIFPTAALSAKPSDAAAHKKGSHHKQHAHHAAKTSPAPASTPKTRPHSSTPE